MPGIKKSIEMKNLQLEALSIVGDPNIEMNWLIAKGKGNKKKECEFIAKSIITKNKEIISKLDLTDIEKNLKSDEHLVVGVAYPAFKEDYDGNFSIPEEITKGIDSLITKGNIVDTDHDEIVNEEIKIVKHIQLESDESFIAAGGETQDLKAGTWITAAIAKWKTWDEIDKGNLNGWSIAGKVEMGTEDINIDDITKDKKGFIGIMKSMFGLSLIEKGKFNDSIKDNQKIAAAKSAHWLFDDVWWDEAWDGTFDGMIEATEEFAEHLKGLDTTEQTTIMKEIKKNKIKGGEDMVKEDIAKAIQEEVKKQVGPLNDKITVLEEENQTLKDEKTEIEKSKKTEIEKTKIKKFIEFGESMGLELEAEEDDTVAIVAKSILEGTNIVEDTESMSNEEMTARLDAEIAIRKGTQKVDVNKSKDGTPGTTLSEITKNIKEGK